MSASVQCIWPLAATLGEGPCWVDGALWFVDILGPRIHCYVPALGQYRSWPAPEPVSFILPAAEGGLIVGLGRSLQHFDPHSGHYTRRAGLDDEPTGNRSNDACIGPDGALWVTTMDLGEQRPTGALYRWRGGRPERLDGGWAIGNGPCFSPDGRRFYVVSSTERTVYVYPVDAAGRLLQRQALIVIEDDAGFPDGLAVDAEGGLWIALWEGGALRRYGEDGALREVLPLPCSRPTKVAFGGEDLRTLFVTTARKGMTEAQLRAEPWAGALLALPAPLPGVPTRRFLHAV